MDIYYVAIDSSQNSNVLRRTIEFVDTRPPEIRVQHQEECGAHREPYNSTPMGVNPIPPAHLHARPMRRTCR